MLINKIKNIDLAICTEYAYCKSSASTSLMRFPVGRSYTADIEFDIGGLSYKQEGIPVGRVIPIDVFQTESTYIPKVMPFLDTIENAIADVIFNNPATIVRWKDGTKTVVKCDPKDTFNKETGLAMAILKKIAGSGNYNDVFRKWCHK